MGEPRKRADSDSSGAVSSPGVVTPYSSRGPIDTVDLSRLAPAVKGDMAAANGDWECVLGGAAIVEGLRKRSC